MCWIGGSKFRLNTHSNWEPHTMSWQEGSLLCRRTQRNPTKLEMFNG
jgi:hypothetical protein